MRSLRRLVAYAWASPNTLIGILAGLLMSVLGASVGIVRGAIEFSGGLLGSWLASPAVACPYHAVTLGHVILATDQAALNLARDHERVHVRQYEQWGPFFLPAYFTSSLWQLMLGRRGYRDNYFERQAFDRS